MKRFKNMHRLEVLVIVVSLAIDLHRALRDLVLM